jgi:hypothetical protein
VLRVVKVGDPRPVTVEFDDYVSLAVDWVEAGSVRPVYYRVSAEDSGDVEVKLEPHTGELIGLVVIESPTERIPIPDAVDRGRLGSIYVDLAEWGLNPDRFPRREVIHDKQILGVGEAEDKIYYSWLPESPDRFVWSGKVGLGVTANDLLTGVLVTR